MTPAGWYPDPAGAPGRFRYWDGQNWSPTTSDRPGGHEPGGPKRRPGPFIVAGVIVLVLVLIGVFVVRGLLRDPVRTTDPGPLPSSTVSGGDDRSPTAAPRSSSPTPSSTPSPTPTPTTADEPCPTGDPTFRATHLKDGRVYGGGLSVPVRAGWSSGQTKQFSWAYDVATQTKVIEQHWVSNLALGALNTADKGFDKPRTAAELVVQCTITSSFYSGPTSTVTSRKDLTSRAVTVDGRPGWALRTEIRIEDPSVDAAGDILQVIVVDTDQPEALSMFLGTASIGDETTLAELDATIKQLRVE